MNRVLSCLIAAACALMAYQIPNRGIDPDEFEHLHAAFCVARGEVPYRDFFEHHAPALYYLSWPLFKVLGPHLSVLWAARTIMFGCSLVALWLTGRLAARWGGARSGLIAAALLAWTTVFQAKGIELRPDVPAMLLLSLAVVPFTFATGGGRWWRFLAVGILCGLATMFTQKSVVLVAGILTAACLSRLMTRAPEAENAVTVLARVIVPIAAGVAAVWGIASLAFATAGAAGEFWYATWYQLWIWPIRSGRWEYLRPTLAGELTVWVAAAIEIGATARQWRHRETWEQQRGAVVLIAAACLASLLVVKATYPQFYLLWMPFLAALAGRRIAMWSLQPVTGSRLAVAVFGFLLLCVGEFSLWLRAIFQRETGALPHLATAAPYVAISFLACALVVSLLAVSSIRKHWGLFVASFASLGMGYGALRAVDLALWSNRDQTAAIEAIHRQVAPDEHVLDGFTGYAALRPHAWYYWWINEYSLALVPAAERVTGLLDRLRANPPAAILFDRNVALLPAPVVDWIREHYAPADPEPLWLRKPAKAD
ncbi:MAG: glycosyltransferase family 39 protein [Planctomycetia bacterium]|nr:glycosyltransferase family 39 protein [Planctomycetia bacterium]